MKRQVHKAIDFTLTAVGILIILGAVFAYTGNQMQVHLLWTVIGLLCVEAGIWGIAVKCMPTERRYSRLREEGDNMIDLIRELNSAALAHKQGLEDESRFDMTLERMHEAVKLMAGLASLEDGQELATLLPENPGKAHKAAQDKQSVANVA